MLVYNDYITFKILATEVNLISTETDYGQSTVAEIDNEYYYLGEEPINIATAIFAWQEFYKRDLTNEELSQIMIDNNLASQAI